MQTKEKKLLIVLLGLAIWAALFFLGYKNFNSKATDYQSQNESLRTRVADLSEMAANADEYQADTAAMNNDIEAIESEFPSDLYVENCIMDAVDMAKDSGADITKIAVEDAVAVDLSSGDSSASTEATTTDETSTETSTDTTTDETASTDTTAASSETSGYELYEMNNTYDISCNTSQLKSLISLITDAQNRQSVTSLTVAYDSNTGYLSGSLTYSAYFLYGLDKAYEAPTIPAMNHGTDDIFGTVSGTEE